MSQPGDNITRRLAQRANRQHGHRRTRRRTGLGILQFSLRDYLIALTLGTICVVGIYQFRYGEWREDWADVPISKSLLPACFAVMLLCSLGLLAIIGRSRAAAGFMIFGCVCCIAVVALSVLIMVPSDESLSEKTVADADQRDLVKVFIISFLGTAPLCSFLGWIAIKDDETVGHIVSRRRRGSRR